MLNLASILERAKALSKKIDLFLKLHDGQYFGPIVVDHQSCISARLQTTKTILRSFEGFLQEEFFLAPTHDHVYALGRPGDYYLYFNPSELAFCINDYTNRQRITIREFEEDDRIEIFRISSRVFRCSELYRISDSDVIEDIHRVTLARTKWSVLPEKIEL